MNYRFHGKQKTMAFGRWPEILLSAARERLADARRLLAEGIDPAELVKLDRIAESVAKQGEQIEDVLKRRVDLVSGKFAMIEQSREFTPVPWRPVLEKHIGKQVSGIMRGNETSWTIGRGKGGPVLS